MGDIESSNEQVNKEKPNESNNTKKSVKKNYFYNASYQLFLIIVPLIVTPYVSRVLTPEGVGQYSFSFSLITYFTIFGALGFTFYAQREIAKYQGDKSAQSKAFWEINICRLIPVFLALFINVFLCSIKVYGVYNQLMWIFNINILALAFDIAYLYQGNEEFAKLVIRNFIIKILSIVAIFLLVKTIDDLWIYTIINSTSILLSNLIMWILSYKLIKRIKVKELKPLRHIKGTFLLFLPTIATSIYTVLDKTLIGALITDTYTIEVEKTVDGITTLETVVKNFSDLENGYYEQSERLVKLPMTIITAIGTVMIPRNSYEFQKGNIEGVRKNVLTSCGIIMMLGIPMMLGFMAIAPNIVPWFFGEGYEKCITLICILSPLILIIGFSNVFGIQYLLPTGNDKKFTIALVIGSIINFVLNMFFIKLWWSIGAAIATLVAECSVTFVMAILVRKKFNFLKILISGWKYFLSGLIMFGCCYFVSRYLSSSILNTLIIIGIGISIYFSLLLIFRDRYLLMALNKIKNKMKL